MTDDEGRPARKFEDLTPEEKAEVFLEAMSGVANVFEQMRPAVITFMNQFATAVRVAWNALEPQLEALRPFVEEYERQQRELRLAEEEDEGAGEEGADADAAEGTAGRGGSGRERRVRQDPEPDVGAAGAGARVRGVGVQPEASDGRPVVALGADGEGPAAAGHGGDEGAGGIWLCEVKDGRRRG